MNKAPRVALRATLGLAIESLRDSRADYYLELTTPKWMSQMSKLHAVFVRTPHFGRRKTGAALRHPATVLSLTYALRSVARCRAAIRDAASSPKLSRIVLLDELREGHGGVGPSGRNAMIVSCSAWTTFSRSEP